MKQFRKLQYYSVCGFFCLNCDIYIKIHGVKNVKFAKPNESLHRTVQLSVQYCQCQC